MSKNYYLLENLNDSQRKAVLTTEGAVLTLAGAGSGKTRTIVHRLAWLIHEKGILPSRIVAVTFTNKAAKEMRERALELAGETAAQCLIRTYHSLGLTFLRKYSRYLDLPDTFTIWDDSEQRAAITALLSKHYKDRFNRVQIRYFEQKISHFKDELISPEDLRDNVDTQNIEFAEILTDIYQKYEELKESSHAVDFADLIYLPVLIFQSYPQVLEEVYERYRYFLVDEYQDTNTAQYMLISLISRHSKNLCVVGDDDQAIYGWRGANVQNILNFKQDFPQAEIIKLEENYRSTQKILDLANSVIRNNQQRMEKTLYSNFKSGELPILVTLYDEQQEAKAVAQLAESLAKTTPANEIAILYRTNGQSRLIEEALLSLNIPYQIFGGLSFFARKEVKDVLAYLKFLINPFDEMSFARLLRSPLRGIGERSVSKLIELRQKIEEEKKQPVSFFDIQKESEQILSSKISATFHKVMQMLKDFSKRAKSADLTLLFDDLLQQSGLWQSIEEEDRLLGSGRMENIIELKNSLLRFQVRYLDADLAQYIQEISLLSSTAELDDNRGVNLMTVHNSKGLEFEHVLVVGLDEDIFPHYLSKQEGDVSEERRLFYVACTRAKRGLYLFRSERKIFQGAYRETITSRFLDEIPEELYKDTSEKKGSAISDDSFARKRQSFLTSNIAVTPTDKKFKSGDRVKHPTFGSGKIFKMEGSGDATKAFILFDDDRKSRKFILKFTNLKKL